MHGLDAAGQFSTARDMALLGKALIHDVPEEYAIHKEKEFTFNKIRQPNRNRLLWSTNLNVDGMKPGPLPGRDTTWWLPQLRAICAESPWCWERKPTAFVLMSQKSC